MQVRTLKSDVLLLITAAIWGAAFVAQRVGMDHMGPFTFNGIRFALGSLSLVPLILYFRKQRDHASDVKPVSALMMLAGSAMAGGALFLGASLQQVGLVYTTAGKAGFITGLYVIIVPILGLCWRIIPGWPTWLGAIFATIGLYLLSVTEEFTIEYGDFLVLIGAFFWACHMLLLGWLSPKMDNLILAALQFLVCSILSLITALAMETITLSGIVDATIPLLYGGLCSVGIAYTLQVVAQKDAPASHAAIILSLESAFAALAGWIILDETLTSRGFLGCTLMLAGMLLSQIRPSISTSDKPLQD